MLSRTIYPMAVPCDFDQQGRLTLSQEHRQVLLLRIVAGLSAREVGELMGRTEDTVLRLQLRALKALREVWKEASAGDDTQDAGNQRAAG